MSRCEYNPDEKRPALDSDPHHGDATTSVGADGQWHLCDSCAALPEFAKFKKRKPLKAAKQEERNP